MIYISVIILFKFYFLFMKLKKKQLLDFVWAVELHRLGLELIGLWPDCKTDEAAKKSHGSDIRVGLVFITVILASGIPLIWALLRVWGDMVLMIDNLRITLPLIVVLIKFVIMRWKRTGMGWTIFVIQNLILHFFSSSSFFIDFIDLLIY